MSDFDIWTESINRGELIQRTDENLGTEYQERLRTNPRNSLSHLTDEQKKLRRALRNRVNAAACRERKATEAKNARLKISTLEKQNTKLTSELERLKELNALYTMQLEEHGITPATLSEQFGQLGEAESFTALQVSSDSRQNQAFSTDRPAVFLDTVNANALPNVLPVA
ncbi:bZIP transcription factor, partial [Rhizobium sp. NFACC06-2]|uniref:bZIP transcription factor n=1 Tax=Rhizobium sp. NFACC06-2 TaxID=1566264 RepID=UPI00087670FA